MLAQRFVACRKAPQRALATSSDRFLPLAEARGRQIAYGGGKLAGQGPVEWKLDGSGRVWFAYAHLDAPNSARAPAKFWSWNLALKRRSRPRCPTRPYARDAPAAQIAR